jgi:deoxyribonuclease V
MYPKRIAVPAGLIRQLTEQQRELGAKVRIEHLNLEPRIVAACDSALTENEIFCVFVAFKFPSLEIIEIVQSHSELTLPYIPGYLAFREAPNLLKAYAKLTLEPDLIFVDGHGVAHPRGMGIASHLGVLINKPTIGIAKSILVGKYPEPGLVVGSYAEIDYKGRMLGYALRSRSNVKPVFVSPGHLVDFEQALEFTLQTLGKYRLPEPTRIADLYSKKLKMYPDQL